MRLLIIADIHSNFAALRAVASSAGLFDGVAFAGDAVGYGPRPHECLDWLRQSCKWAVRGHHDEAVAQRSNCRSPLRLRLMAVSTRAMNQHRVTQADRDYLGTLPLTSQFLFGRRRFGMVHATPGDPLFRDLDEKLSDADFRAALEPLVSEVDVLILGHSHRPFIRALEGVTVVNPGSVGFPEFTAPQAAYAIWDEGELTLHRVNYPVKDTVWELEKCGLQPEQITKLKQILENGAT